MDTGLATGGRTHPVPIDTTDDHLGTVTAQGEYISAGEVAINAFDDTTGTKWLDSTTTYPSTRQSWINYQYPNGIRWAVLQYTITSANDATTYPGRSPANWRLLGSNNGGSSWTTLDIQTNQTFTANFQKLTYPITNTTPYNLYRFQIDSVANPAQATCMQLDELEFVAVPPVYTYWWSFGDGATSSAQNPQYMFATNGSYTATLVVSDGLSTATNTVVVTVTPPSLVVRPQAPGGLSLGWPAWATGYQLYSTTNLAPPVTWTLDTNAITTLNGTNWATVPLKSASRFFQLRR